MHSWDEHTFLNQTTILKLSCNDFEFWRPHGAKFWTWTRQRGFVWNFGWNNFTFTPNYSGRKRWNANVIRNSVRSSPKRQINICTMLTNTTSRDEVVLSDKLNHVFYTQWPTFKNARATRAKCWTPTLNRHWRGTLVNTSTYTMSRIYRINKTRN